MTKELTGRHVLMIAFAAFGTIVAANMALLYAALGSFPGLEVKNSYVASQAFDREAHAQARLGWQSTLVYEDGAITLRIVDEDGVPVVPMMLAASIGRPTHDRADKEIVFTDRGEAFATFLKLQEGPWRADIRATAADGTPYRVRLDLVVRDPS